VEISYILIDDCKTQLDEDISPNNVLATVESQRGASILSRRSAYTKVITETLPSAASIGKVHFNSQDLSTIT